MGMGTEGKRVTSTARKIKYMWVAKLLSIFLSFDLFMLIVIVAGAFYYTDVQAVGKLGISYEREINSTDEGIAYSVKEDRDSEKTAYVIYNPDSNSLIYREMITNGEIKEIYLDIVIRIARAIIFWAAFLQIFTLIEQLCASSSGIRYKLQPINEMAETANRLSSMNGIDETPVTGGFDENKVHDLEAAIYKISPDGPDGVLKTRDEDLKGLEVAINNMLERMRESYRQQSRFVSDASHELRTPIAVIQGYVNMLDRWGKEDETILEESIEAIKNESEHMKKLVEQLLFLARGDAGRNQMNFEEFSLSDMMKEVYEESIMIDEKHAYDFREDDTVVVYADNHMLKQTARILVDNASKYTRENDLISLRCGVTEDGNAYFSVQDNGIGMKESDVSHVFERFYRSDEARDKRTGGTGLGLSIAKWIVERHEGHFEVLSREELGTRITVVLPAKKHKVDAPGL